MQSWCVDGGRGGFTDLDMSFQGRAGTCSRGGVVYVERLLTWVGVSGAWRDHTVVVDLVVERIRPAGRVVLVHGHRRVVREVVVVQHLEHAVTADLKTGAN